MMYMFTKFKSSYTNYQKWNKKTNHVVQNAAQTIKDCSTFYLKDRQHNDQNKKRTHNDIYNATKKILKIKQHN